MEYSKDILKFEIAPFSTSCKNDRCLLIYDDRHFEISQSLSEFIKILQKNSSTKDVAIAYSQEKGIEYSNIEVDEIYKRYISPILEDSSKTKTSFYFKLNLISPDSISKCVKITSKLFMPVLGGILLFVILVLELSLYLINDDFFSLSEANGFSIILTILYFCASSFFHEIGHASACEYFKIKHGSIGVGVYWIFPVFFTDVSGVWRLSRKKRIIVNFAGVYFQLIALIPFFIGYILTRNELMMYFITAININLLITLNPFFKFDGYWVCTDVLGIPNLRSRTKELFSYMFKRIANKKTLEKPFLIFLKPREKWGFIAYSLLVNLFFCYFFLYCLPLILVNTLESLPVNIETTLYYFSSGNLPSLSLLKTIGSQLIIIVLISTALAKAFLIPLFKNVNKKSRR